MLKLYVKTKLIKDGLKNRVVDIRDNIEGASLIEYSLLIGLITAAVVGTIVIIGGRVEGWWTDLDTATTPAP